MANLSNNKNEFFDQKLKISHNLENSLYISNIDPKTPKSIIYELLIQVGKPKNIYYPKNKQTGEHLGYCFVEYSDVDECIYTMRILNFVRLYNKPLYISRAKNNEFIAKLCVKNILLFDEEMLYDMFKKFGECECRIVRDENGKNRGYGFVEYKRFADSDRAIEEMNGKFVADDNLIVDYAMKRDGSNEKYGCENDRKKYEK
ncbi:Spliceosome-associated protein 49 [Dictyocoela muelleri]|nr:Spliceosome-associated protein 49 [Dictyocoela muelleri]